MTWGRWVLDAHVVPTMVHQSPFGALTSIQPVLVRAGVWLRAAVFGPTR